MNERTRFARLLAVGAVMLVSGCAQRAQGIPSAVSEPAHHNVPRVPHPVDATRFLAQPCAVLTSPQLGTLRLDDPGKPDTTSSLARYSGPSCSWHNRNELTSVLVGFVTSNKAGLTDIYRGHDQGQFPGYWQETTVDGNPAVFSSIVDSRPQGFCTLVTGISDTLVVLVDRDLHTGQDACESARETTSLLLNTLRGG